MSMTPNTKININSERNKLMYSKDIKSIHAFKTWLKENLKDRYKSGSVEIPESDIKVFLDYITKKVTESKDVPEESKKLWLKDIRNILNTQQVVKESGNE